ncbi:hypothetical protein HYV49_05250 [Candidatus Pacearchaeota archaeon]|nr:hypothetical protein [Candidatus Pacearchaeota archaeon]
MKENDEKEGICSSLTAIMEPENKNRKSITEEMGIHKEWYIQAKEQDMETLPEFMRHLSEDYDHDYGTICHAITASALAAATAFDRGPQGGITGFQAGCIMWEFILHWNALGVPNDSPLKLVQYYNMLYPQYENQFQKTISESTWKYLQEQAKKYIAESTEEKTDTEVWKHWKSIVDGMIPFGYTVRQKNE